MSVLDTLTPAQKAEVARKARAIATEMLEDIRPILRREASQKALKEGYSQAIRHCMEAGIIRKAYRPLVFNWMTQSTGGYHGLQMNGVTFGPRPWEEEAQEGG